MLLLYFVWASFFSIVNPFTPLFFGPCYSSHLKWLIPQKFWGKFFDLWNFFSPWASVLYLGNRSFQTCQKTEQYYKKFDATAASFHLCFFIVLLFSGNTKLCENSAWFWITYKQCAEILAIRYKSPYWRIWIVQLSRIFPSIPLKWG